MKHLTPIILLVIALLVVLFVFVPLSFVILGKLENPFSFAPASVASIAKNKPKIDCNDKSKAYEPHIKDTSLSRDEEKSSIASIIYKLNINLDTPISDWQYTNGVLENEIASFVYKDTIVNILAKTNIVDCNTQINRSYEDFHEKTEAVEYFSSNNYLKQNSPIGLSEAILKNHGQSKIGDNTFYWYLIDEKFINLSSKSVSTIWYITRVGRIEYWFAFRTFKENEENLNNVAEEVLENTELRKF